MSANKNKANFMKHVSPNWPVHGEIHSIDQCARKIKVDDKERIEGHIEGMMMPMSEDWEKRHEIMHSMRKKMLRGGMTQSPKDAYSDY